MNWVSCRVKSIHVSAAALLCCCGPFFFFYLFNHFSFLLLGGLWLTGESAKPSVKCWQSNGTLFHHSARAFSISEGGVISRVTGGQTSPSSGTAHHQMFVSDYTVRALTDVTYLRVSRFLYQAARSATLLERAQITSDNRAAATAANGRLSFDSAITAATVDSSQLTPTSSFGYSSIVDDNTRSIVDATVLASHLEQQQQSNQESKSTCSGDTIHV